MAKKKAAPKSTGKKPEAAPPAAPRAAPPEPRKPAPPAAEAKKAPAAKPAPAKAEEKKAAPTPAPAKPAAPAAEAKKAPAAKPAPAKAEEKKAAPTPAPAKPAAPAAEAKKAPAAKPAPAKAEEKKAAPTPAPAKPAAPAAETKKAPAKPAATKLAAKAKTPAQAATAAAAPPSSTERLREVSPAHLHPYVEPPAQTPYLDYGPTPPQSYDRDSFTALPVHPGLVFVYWELTGEEGRREQGTGQPWVLRCHDESSGVSWEIPVDIRGENYYIHVRPGTQYRFELGTVGPQGFKSLRATPSLRTPRVEAPPLPDTLEWAHFREDVGQEGVMKRRQMAVRLLPGGAFVKGMYCQYPLQYLPGASSFMPRA